MRPFALRFAVAPENPIQSHVEPMRYDPDSEMMLLMNSPENQQVIEWPSILMATGTHITRAQVDPTRDEPTDRWFIPDTKSLRGTHMSTRRSSP